MTETPRQKLEAILAAGPFHEGSFLALVSAAWDELTPQAKAAVTTSEETLGQWTMVAVSG